MFDNSFSCYPQILQASKQVKNEATNILYGDNLIDLKFRENGITIHGQKVDGPWPKFLRKVQFLRISYGSQVTTFQEDYEIPSWCTVGLYQLCEYLANSHMLRSVNVCFTHAPPAIGLPSYDARFDVCALRLLGSLKECVVEGVDGPDLRQQMELEAPLRVNRPHDVSKSDAWLAYYHVCLEKWDEFSVDCYRFKASLGPARNDHELRVKNLMCEIRRVFRDDSRRPLVKEPGGKRKTYLKGLEAARGVGVDVPLRWRIITRFDTLLETEEAYGNFVASIMHVAEYMKTRWIPQTLPTFLQEFFHFYIDARLARVGCEDQEMLSRMFPEAT